MDVDKKIRPSWGFAWVLLLSFIPMFAWKFGYELGTDHAWQAVALSLAKIGAFGGMAMFALSLILSGRYKFYEWLFGGLDKMYVAHRFLGTFSVLLLFIHPVSLTVLRLEEGTLEALSLWFKVSDFAVWLGSIALYLLAGIVLWSVFARARYEVFLQVHRVLGVVFIIGAAHAFFAGSILADNAFMYWYMLVLTVLAGFTFLVYSVLGDLLHRPIRYKLKKIKDYQDDVVQVTLEPITRIIKFAPGQFVYISFDDLASQGFHPFSISSGKQYSDLVLSIRKSGDFTSALDSLNPGAVARVKGPFGGFILRLNSRRKQLWIAGGIGVTPFLSGAVSLKHVSRRVDTDVEMIYASDDAEPYGLKVLERVEARNKAFNVTLYNKDTFGYVTFAALEDQLKDLHERDIYICGPPAMLEALRKEARLAGFEHKLHYEEFSY